MSDTLSHRNSDTCAGTYQIWQKAGKGFRHVANVEGGNHMAAVILPMLKRGTPGTERVTWLVKVARPSSVGDKIVDPNGVAYEIYRCDFGGIAIRKTGMPEESQFLERKSQSTDRGRDC